MSYRRLSQTPRTYASLAYAPAPETDNILAASPIAHYPPTQPPSYKPAEFRKTQLHRQYTSLLRSSPLILLFQHNNLKAVEWSGLRRELASALKKVDAELAAADPAGAAAHTVGESAKLQIVQTGIFASALKVVEFFSPDTSDEARTHHPTDPRSATSTSLDGMGESTASVHGLSRSAWEEAKIKSKNLQTGLEPLLSGPLMAVTFPAVSPQHLKAALHILSPGGSFPAPRRKANPGLYEPAVQNGLQKLMLLGARVEGEVFDVEGTRWVGGIEGGIGGLRSQLVYMLQSVSAGLTNTLEGASKSLYVTMESRRLDMEGPEKKDEPAEKTE